MNRLMFVMVLSLYFCLGAVAQQDQSDKGPGENQAPPRSDRNKEAGESSSRDTKIDITPPKDDANKHPDSVVAVTDAQADATGVQEFHPYDPHKAAKDIEVGDFYFKRRNYRAAMDRYREALEWKPNDALANFHMGQCLEKLNEPAEARGRYEAYLKILPHGPLAEEAQKALDRLKSAENRASETVPPKN